MSPEKQQIAEETEPLTRGGDGEYVHPRSSIDSSSTASLSFALVDRINGSSAAGRTPLPLVRSSTRIEGGNEPYRDEEKDLELEDGDDYIPPGGKPVQKRVKVVFWLLVLLCLGGWSLAFVLFLLRGHAENADVASGPKAGNGGGDGGVVSIVEQPGKGRTPLDLGGVLASEFAPKRHGISWLAGANGEDGLLLQVGGVEAKPYLYVEDVTSRKGGEEARKEPLVLMKNHSFSVGDKRVTPSEVWPSPGLKTVLVVSDKEKNWRHSFTGIYWLFDVETQTGQPLDPDAAGERIQLASWSPQSDAVVFTRGNNMFIRELSSKKVRAITRDGGVDLFYGVPDWVYEEEVYSGNSVTWWSEDGKYVAFLRTNESMVPEFPVQYFVSRPSGKQPLEGEENYPDVVDIKYPKAGAPNPVVNILFYDVEKREVFSVDIKEDFPDDDRLIIEVIWAAAGKVLVRETNRESDVVTIVLVDARARTGKVVRSEDIAALDGGWVEPSQSTRFIPADPDNGRAEDGYIDTVIHNDREHLGYFTPLDNPKPVMLTSSPDWDVDDAPSAVDLKRGLVYFVAATNSPGERHVFSVKFDGTDLTPVTNTSESAYYDISFSHGAGYALLNYQGPHIPWQKVISTPANDNHYEDTIEKNEALEHKIKQYALPTLIYQNVTIDGFTLPVVERRPPNFDPNRKYPVLFYLYGGPKSQTVSQQFRIDFQTYVASTLGYIVVTVDGRGTGFIGRKARTIIRDNIGHYEARDQIETAKIWAKKGYVAADRMAIWGWSYGGFMTLKTLEQNAGRTFRYGMAVAPVTDWQFYDSIYTERYMHTPQNNPGGYENSTISNMTALQSNVRFLFMHGSADDNVHMQNSLTLLDKLDLAGVDNYDVHVFPDSDHSIYFHNARLMVYGRLADWLVNAFNGEWLKIANPKPVDSLLRRAVKLLTP
ncbi:hypothetical protein AJ80_04920 [Polytolypa hystricis UAMH7299]|uniref:Probable dipeptidyl-aminopeptidase B n=1 Tax=Polytolypa hystricis (strain UAMH7299) TaxID=1447883 RepID=A0A2B7Y829_POLH7|nr:hypothetical protein AJ80_04920 [Polytolypa hystricis UAMH7299]